MLRITRAQLISKVCVRQTQTIRPLASQGLHSSAIARVADDKNLETTSLSGKKFVPKFAQVEHIQINWRRKPRTEPSVTLPRTAAALPLDTGYATLFSAPPPFTTHTGDKYTEFVNEAKAALHYLKVPKNLRPLVFRSKNADVLEELNVLYPNGNSVTSLSPRKFSVTAGIVDQVINNAQTLEELYEARDFLHDSVIYAPEATHPYQLLNLYNKMVAVGGFGKAESILQDGILTEYLLQEAARIGTVRSKVLYRVKNSKTKGIRDMMKALRRVYKIDITKGGHVEFPVELLIIYYLASTGLNSEFSNEIVQQVRKYKIDPDMTAKRVGSTEAALRSRIMFKDFVTDATQRLEKTNAEGLKNVPQAAANDMYLDAKITLEAIESPTNDWNIDTQPLAKQLRAYISLLEKENVDKKAVEDKINLYVNSREDSINEEAKEAAEKVAAARNNADPTYSEEVREGIYDKEPTVDGKTVQQLDAEEAEIGREAKAHKKAAPIQDDGMSPEAKAAAEKVAAARNDPAPTYSEEVREGIYDKEPTVDGKTVQQLDAEEAEIGREAKAHKKAAPIQDDGMSPEAKAAAEKVAAARNDPAPTYSEEVREGIYDKEPTVDGKTVQQLDAEEAEIGREAKAHKKAAPIQDDGMSPEAKAAAEKVAAARNDPAPTYSEEVREGIYDKEPTVDGKTVQQLDAEEAKIAEEAKKHPYNGQAKNFETMSPEAKAAAEKVAAARNDPAPTYSEEVREGIYDAEPTVDGKTVQQLDAEEAEIGREAKAHKKAAPIQDDGMSPEAKAAAEKVAAARNDPAPTYSEEVREGIYDKEPTVDGKTVQQLDAEEAEIGREAKAHKKAAPIQDDGMSPEAKAAAEKVAAARNNADPTYSEEVREGIYDKEPTVDGKTVQQLDAEEAEIGREAKAHKKAAPIQDDGMSPEAKAAAEKVAAARNNADPTYSEEVREGIYDKQPTVDGKTVEQLDAEEAKIAVEAKLRREGKLPKE